MINIDNISFNFDPFPYGVAKNIFSKIHYSELVKNFPKISDMSRIEEKDNLTLKFNKFALSSRNNPVKFNSVINKNNTYKDFCNYLLSEQFKNYLINILKKNNVDFGINTNSTIKKKIKKILTYIFPFSILKPTQEIDIVVEFSSIPSNGGFLKPHTDGQHKLASIVIPIVDNDWKKEFNGGTNLLRPLDETKTYNLLNNTYEFEECFIVKTIDFDPNQFLIFLKTYNSFHSVGPLKSNVSNHYRNSITLIIEKKFKI